MPPRKTTARRPGQQTRTPSNRPFKQMGWATASRGGTKASFNPNVEAWAFSPGKTKHLRVSHTGKQSGEYQRLIAHKGAPMTDRKTGAYGGTKPKPRGVTTGDVLRSAARKRTIKAAKAKEKKRVASYKPKYRMGSRGGVRDDT